MSDAPSIAERYSSAIKSSHLELKVDPGDIDYLIAAGYVRETLAIRLIRLRSTFDSFSAPKTLPRPLIPALSGFRETREALRAYAVAEAPQRGLDEARAADAALKVLDLFLQPNCPLCDGRGFTGGYGVPTIRCTACRETGKRALMWRNDAEEAFAGWLQSNLESKIAIAMGEMRRWLRPRDV